MERAKIARELVNIAREVSSLTVYDVSKYMEFALDDMKPLSLMIHSLKARIKDAKDATLDRRVISNLDKLSKQVAQFEKMASSLQRAFQSMS